jgi:hypothetical protein
MAADLARRTSAPPQPFKKTKNMKRKVIEAVVMFIALLLIGGVVLSFLSYCFKF